jgi:hypothetical protein
MPRGTTRVLGPASHIELSRRMLAEKSQHRRLHLRSASHGYAPAPAASTQLATKKTWSALKSRCRGTSVSPLDKTYHGGPRMNRLAHWLVNKAATIRNE